jgi:hypothetical protein
VAEVIYQIEGYGAATDRHLLRFSVSHGWLSNESAASSSTKPFLTLKSLFPEQQHSSINEVAGVIAQMLRLKEGDHKTLLGTITTVAERHGHQMSMKRFLLCCDLSAVHKQLLSDL